MREIGSEFCDVPITENTNTIFPESTQWFLSGRIALQSIIAELKGKKTIAMPSWCCDSMVKPFIEAGIKVRFYPVYSQNGFCQELCYDCDILFVMDYFGYIVNIDVSHSCIIRDLTHSVFSKSYNDADYYFGSLRKWCGVWTGGFAWVKDHHKLKSDNNDDTASAYINLRQKAMVLKDCYINEKSDNFGNKVTDKKFLSVFNEAEELLEVVGIASAAERDIALAEKLDVGFIKEQRRKNAKVLMQAFADHLIFPTLKESDCPMFVPVLIPNGKRDALRQYLIQNDIYCPVHWPVSEFHKLDEQAAELYENELSLVCDQRYTEEDMWRMVDIVKAFWKEN